MEYEEKQGNLPYLSGSVIIHEDSATGMAGACPKNGRYKSGQKIINVRSRGSLEK